MGLGFTFNGIHSSAYNLIARSQNRDLLPALRVKEVIIPGRDGSYNFTGNSYENRDITILLSYIGSSYSDLRSKARQISAWLSQTGDYKELIFDDEPDKYYLAKIYSAAPLSNLFRKGEVTINFTCQPFAFSVTESSQTETITTNNQEISIQNNGTVETPMVITIENTGGNTITGFTITRQIET